MSASSLLLKLLSAYGPQLVEFLKPLLAKVFQEFVKKLHDEAATGKLDDGLLQWKEVIQTAAKVTHDKLTGVDILGK